MILVKPSFEVLTNQLTWNMLSKECLNLLEVAGRTCYKSEPKGDPETFIRGIIKSGHESVIEHFNITVRIICDRGVSHEVVRHRLVSYSQESTRWCNYSGGVTFVIPSWLSEYINPGEYISGKHSWQSTDAGARLWFTQMTFCELDYIELINRGWTPQQARSILPNSLKTELIMTCNLREWRHFFKLRTSKRAHPQMREIAIPMLKEFKTLLPVVFEDIAPNQK